MMKLGGPWDALKALYSAAKPEFNPSLLTGAGKLLGGAGDAIMGAGKYFRRCGRPNC